MAQALKVLLVEDDREIIEAISLAFRIRWHEAKVISSRLGEQGIEMAKKEAPDVMILDLGLPDINGFEVLRRVRQFSSVPIIILTVRSDEEDVVRGLEGGADDYIVKPFRQLEFLARIKALIRRQQPAGDEIQSCGSLRLNTATGQLEMEGKEIPLTVTENHILAHLMKNVGRVVTHTSLSEAVWGDYYPGAADSLKVHIRRLREKIETDPGHPRLILTKIGVGYFLTKLE